MADTPGLHFPYKYGSGFNLSDDDLIRFAVRAIQTEVKRRGFDPGVIDGEFGGRTKTAVIGFQKKFGLYPDGVCGPKTCRALWTELISFFEGIANIPDHLLCGLVANESASDPGAIGPNGRDTGLAQINLDAHPDISRAQAFDAVFSLAYATTRMMQAHETFSRSAHPELAWKCSVLQHNSPALALKYSREGTLTDQKALDYIKRIEDAC